MQRKEQREFIETLMDRMKENILHVVDEGKIPEEWDGKELRWLITDFVNDQAIINKPDKRSKDWREYNNYLLVNYLW